MCNITFLKPLKLKSKIIYLVFMLVCLIPLRMYSQKNSDFKKKDIFSFNSEQMFDYKQSLNRYQNCQVIIENDSIKYVKFNSRKINSKMTFPPNLNKKLGLYETEGNANSIEVFNGWIVGIDAGEFGAGLFWYSKDGKTVENLRSSANQMIKVGDKILGINGLAHMSSAYGSLVQIFFENNKWQVKTLYKCDGCPYVFNTDSDSNIYIITSGTSFVEYITIDKKGNAHHSDNENSALIRIDKNMQVHYLIKNGFWSMAYPNSMELYKGSIYVGMRGGILKVTEKKNSIEKEWLENK